MANDNTETLVEQATEEVNELVDKNIDSVDSGVRYAAYGARLQTALRAGSRYVAYTSDIGEAFRPVMPPWIVTAAYGVSWLYLSGDVGYETYKAHRQGPNAFEMEHFSEPARLSMVAVKRGTFQAVASMALPALTIHTAVRQATKAFANVKNPRMKAWGPTITGLAIVPGLPYLFDHPVEYVTEKAFGWAEGQIARMQEKKKNAKDRKEL